MRRTTTIAIITMLVAAGTLSAQTRIKDVTRLKGERTHELKGIGLVIGLSGTGDSKDFLPAIEALTSVLTKYQGLYTDETLVPRLTKLGNVAIVEVSATLPPYHREGSRIDVRVASLGTAKSLKGGRLIVTPLQSSRPDDDTVYSVAGGSVIVNANPNTGIIRKGATIEKALETEVIENGTFSLVLCSEKADLTTASMIASRINSEYRREHAMLEAAGRAAGLPDDIAAVERADMVKVSIPTFHRTHPYDYIAEIERLDIGRPDAEARVIIDEQTQTVVSGLEVRISPVVTMHRDMALVIEEGENSTDLTLKDVFDGMKQLEATGQDLIEVVKMLDEAGVLHGKVEFK